MAPRGKLRAIVSEPSKIYELKVVLTGSKPPIWRTIVVRDTTLLSDLHYILQTTMGWTNYHLHQFIQNKKYYGHPELLDDMDCIDYRKLRIKDLLKEPKDTLDYEYDFGDSWMHRIVLQKVTDPVRGQYHPYCLDGAMACPPEDCGNIPGYMHVLKVISNPKHKEYAAMIDWLGGGTIDPEEFDLEEINGLLTLPNYGMISLEDLFDFN